LNFGKHDQMLSNIMSRANLN